MSFSHFASGGSSLVTTNAASATPTLPAGLAVGDLIILRAWGQFNNHQTWADPSGYTPLGTQQATTVAANRGVQEVQLWYKIAGSSETSPTLTAGDSDPPVPGFSSAEWRCSVHGYRPSDAGVPVVTVTDATGTGSSVTPSGFTLNEPALILADMTFNAIGTSGTLSPTQGFTTRESSGSRSPGGQLVDKTVDAGAVTMPTLTGGVSTPYVVKVIVFASDGFYPQVRFI